jgi:class 3 adenylate cyclase
MGAEKIGTRAEMTDLLHDVVSPLLATHHGRLFKTVGDGFLAECASVVEAMECAMHIPRQVAQRPVTAGRQVRIGINLGDVIVEGDDLHGDGVNVAVRLEALAEPGGVCISRSADDQIRDKFAHDIADMGELEQARGVVAENFTRMPQARIATSFIQISDPVAMARVEGGLRLAGPPD